MGIINISCNDLLISSKSFKIKKTNGKIGMLFVSVDWCGHCQNFKPIYKKFGEVTNNELNLFYLDGDTCRTTLKKMGIQGFPTIYHVNIDGTLEPYTEPRDLFSLTKEFCKRFRTGSICRI